MHLYELCRHRSKDHTGKQGGDAALYVDDRRYPPCSPDEPASAVRSGGNGHAAPPMYLRTEMTSAPAPPIDEPSPTVPKSGNQYLHRSDPGVRRGPMSRPDLLDSPSPAVCATESKGTTVTPTTGTRRSSDVQRASDVLYLGAGIRRLTVAECQILQAWPADWPLQGGITNGYKIVGNGCCPPVVEAIGRAVIKSAAGLSDV